MPPPPSHRSPWKLYASLFRGAGWPLALCVALSAAQALTVLPIALLVRTVFDRAIPAHDATALILAGLGIVSAVALSSALALTARRLTLRVVKRAIARLRTDLVDRLLALPRAFHTRADRGALHAGIVQDTERLDTMSVEVINQFVPAIVISTGLAAILAWLNWRLFFVLVATWPVALLIGRGTRTRLRDGVRSYHRALESYSQRVLRLLESIDLVRMQTAERVETVRQRETIETLRRDSAAVAWQGTVHGTLHDGIMTITGMLILLLGGWETMQGRMSFGALVSFYVATRSLNSAHGNLLAAVPKLIVGRASLDTLGRLLRGSEARGEWSHYPLTGEMLADFQGGIEFRDVTFSYLADDGEPQADYPPLLRGIDLAIEPGRATAIVGLNGAGKSTLLHLLLGFYRPQTGTLLADGQPYETLDLTSLRAGIGVVPQEPMFFAGTVRENLTYGTPDADADEVARAVALATADEFINRLPHGLETTVGEGGMLLSGGQRQRLALARAILRRPQLLVLDEPTNHLDRASVDALVRHLLELAPAPAILLVSHDAAVVARCCKPTRVFALRDGRLTPLVAGSAGSPLAPAPAVELPALATAC